MDKNGQRSRLFIQPRIDFNSTLYILDYDGLKSRRRNWTAIGTSRATGWLKRNDGIQTTKNRCFSRHVGKFASWNTSKPSNCFVWVKIQIFYFSIFCRRKFQRKTFQKGLEKTTWFVRLVFAAFWKLEKHSANLKDHYNSNYVFVFYDNMLPSLSIQS